MSIDAKIQELNPSDVPMVDTDYYKWLNVNHTHNWHRIEDKRGYLIARGFIYGEDKLSEETIHRLKAIHSMHFHWEHTA